MLRMALLQGTLDPTSDDTVEKLMQQLLWRELDDLNLWILLKDLKGINDIYHSQLPPLKKKKQLFWKEFYSWKMTNFHFSWTWYKRKRW